MSRGEKGTGVKGCIQTDLFSCIFFPTNEQAGENPSGLFDLSLLNQILRHEKARKRVSFISRHPSAYLKKLAYPFTRSRSGSVEVFIKRSSGKPDFQVTPDGLGVFFEGSHGRGERA